MQPGHSVPWLLIDLNLTVLAVGLDIALAWPMPERRVGVSLTPAHDLLAPVASTAAVQLSDSRCEQKGRK